MLTLGGDLERRRRYFGSKSGGGVCPVDASMGIAWGKTSPAVREVCCTRGVVQDFAQETLSLTDGGPWIRNQILQPFKRLDAMVLDFYHLSEHVWSTAHAYLGEADEAKTWAQRQWHDLQQVGPRTLPAAIDTLNKKVRSADQLDALRLLRQYVVERWEHALSLEGMVDYPRALARGWDIGSGPTEAIPSRLRTWCKNLTLRLKRTGMKHVLSREGWDTDHAAGLMSLVALREGGQGEPSLRGSGQDGQTRKTA